MIGYHNALTVTVRVGFIPKEIFAKKFFKHSIPLLANSRAINSDSIVDLVIMYFLIDFHASAPPPNVST